MGNQNSSGSIHASSLQVSSSNTEKKPRKQTSLPSLRKISHRKAQIGKISRPAGVEHGLHVEYDPDTKKYVVLLNANGRACLMYGAEHCPEWIL